MFDVKNHADNLLGRDRRVLERREAKAEHLFQRSKNKAVREFHRACDRGDVVGTIALGRVLHRHGAMDDKQIYSLCVGLLAEGMAEEALQALPAVPSSSTVYPATLRARAEALAMLGRLQEAHSSAQEGLQPHAEPHRRKLASRLGLALALQPRASGSWADADGYVQVLLTLGAREVAAKALAALSANPPALDDAGPKRAIEVALAALSILKPAKIAGLVGALRERFPDDEEVLALHLRWLVRSGRAAEARALILGGEILKDAARALRFAVAEALDATGEIEAAIALLGALCVEHEDDLELRQALAFCTGRLVNATTPTAYAAARPRKIFSLFPFYNELTILKIRLREMADWVDGFVLVEAAQTFAGAPKPFHFDDFRAAVAEYEPKIHRVRLDAFPACCEVTPWAREFYQRDMAVKGLDGLWTPDDLVLVTDVDEIVDRKALDGFQGSFASLRMQTHAFFLNYCAVAGTPSARRRSGFVCRADVLNAFGSSYLRMAMVPQFKNRQSLPDAGWHLTSIGDAAAVTEKYRSYSHQEANKADFRVEAVNEVRLDGIRAGRPDPAWKRREIDETFPAYIREHRDELSDLIL